MKNLKLFLPLLLVALIGSLTFTACDKPFLASEDMWYTAKETIADQNYSMYFYYTSKDEPQTKGEITVSKGLTIVMRNTSNKDLAQTYLYKTFEPGKQDLSETETTADGTTDTTTTGTTTSDESETEKSNITISGTLMDGLYVYFGKSFRNSETETTPEFLTEKSYTAVTQISDLTEGLTWKKVFAKILLSYLED